MHTVRARVLALLAVLLVALPLGAMGGDQYFCRTMGRLMDSSCCKSERSVQTTKVQGCASEVKSAGCCELMERGDSDGVPALRDGVLRVASPSVATAPPFVVLAPELSLGAAQIEAVQARAPPRAGPSVFLKNCSFLI